MTKLEQILEFAKNLPEEQQDHLANDLLNLMRTRNSGVRLQPNEIADVEAALANKAAKYASEAEVLAVLSEIFS